MKTLLNIKADQEVKEEAQKVAREFGLPLSTIINAYLKEFIRDRELYFSLEPKIKPGIGTLLKQASKDYKKGRNVIGPFLSWQKMDAYLDK